MAHHPACLSYFTCKYNTNSDRPLPIIYFWVADPLGVLKKSLYISVRSEVSPDFRFLLTQVCLLYGITNVGLGFSFFWSIFILRT